MPTATTAPQTRTEQGHLRGARRDGVSVFANVPYGTVPPGLRFAAARPAPGWDGVRDAGTPGPACPQLPSPFAALFADPDEPQSEDCLHLTVWTPGADDRRRPVVVWLHGGSYLTGSGNLPRYDGGELAAEQDVVVVLVTYRIGVLGFPPFPDTVPMSLTGDGPDARFATGDSAVANVGAWDLFAALQWLRRNVSAFGGNPDALCAIGQSAGAQILAGLLTVPATTSLVARAVLHSAPLGLDAVDGAEASAAFADRTGAGTAATARDLDVATLLDGQRAVLEGPVSRGDPRPGVRLSADGILAGDDLPGPPASDLPLLVTTTRDECRLWLSDPSRRDDAAALTDAMFTAPSRAWAGAAAENGNPVRLARFDMAARGEAARFGAAHCIDVPFVLSSADGRRMPLLDGWTEPELATLRDEVRGRWAAFARGELPAEPVTVFGADGHSTSEG